MGKPGTSQITIRFVKKVFSTMLIRHISVVSIYILLTCVIHCLCTSFEDADSSPVKTRRKRFSLVEGFNLGNLFALQILPTATRPTNFILLRLNIKMEEENQRRRAMRRRMKNQM